MHAIILAAGLGKRMRPLTLNTPKPLLKANNRALIEFHLEALSKTMIKQVVINTHWCAEQVLEALGNGARWGLDIQYSHEPELLETAGGIQQALQLLDTSDNQPFLLINGDIYCELNLNTWIEQNLPFADRQSACLAMVPNPAEHPEGDFILSPEDGWLSCRPEQPGQVQDSESCLTYAGIALFRPEFFAAMAPGPAPLAPMLNAAMPHQRIRGALVRDYWLDIGTPERLATLDRHLARHLTRHLEP